jgi:FKBP-type peptidyl-prolyl cis-trans isomerase (trigger factor)
MISALARLPDGSLELTINIPWKQVENTYQKILENLQKKATIDGFRPGKAPIKKVEEKIGKSTIYEQTLKDLLPEVYLEAVREQKITPILAPKTQLTSAEEGKDWQIKAITCELPKVSLGEYEKATRAALAGDKIWTPGKEVKKEDKAKDESQQLEKIFKALLETAKVTLPEILIEEEVNRMLSRLLDQTEKLGLTVEQYLTSVGKTSEQLRAEYRKQAEQTLKLELILSAIADDKKIVVSEAELQKMIDSLPDKEAKNRLTGDTQKAYLKQLLRKRSVIDHLLKL